MRGDGHLTRIRPNFWTFQDKHPKFGSNPGWVWKRRRHDHCHARNRRENAGCGQTEIAEPVRYNDAACVLLSPMRSDFNFCNIFNVVTFVRNVLRED